MSFTDIQDSARHEFLMKVESRLGMYCKPYSEIMNLIYEMHDEGSSVDHVVELLSGSVCHYINEGQAEAY